METQTTSEMGPGSDLGKVLLEQRVSAKKHATISFIVGGGIVAFALTMAVLVAREGKSRVSPVGPAAFFAVVGLVVAGFGVLALVKGDTATRICEHGFAQKTKDGALTLRFDEMDGFRCWIAYGTAAQIGFRFIPRGADPEDRKHPNWTGVNSYMAKADQIRAYLTELFLNRMLASLQAGQAVQWGPGKLTPTGVELEGKSIKWKEITLVKIRNNGMAVISTADQGDVALSIDTLNFWPGYAILEQQLDPAIFK